MINTKLFEYLVQNNDISLNSAKAAYVVHSLQGSVNAESSDIPVIIAHKDIKLKDCTAKVATAINGKIEAINSKCESITCKELKLTNCHVELVTSSKIEADRSELCEAHSIENITLTSCIAAKVNSTLGSISWKNEKASTTNSVIAEKKVDLKNISASYVESKGEDVHIMLGTIEKVQAKDRAFINGATVADAKSLHLNLAASKVKKATAEKLFITSSSIEELTILLTKEKEGSIEQGVLGENVIHSIFVKRESRNQQINKARTIFNITGEGLLSYTKEAPAQFNFPGDFNPDGTVPENQAQNFKYFVKPNQICEINGRYFKFESNTFVPTTYPVPSSEKKVMTQKEMEEYVIKNVTNNGNIFLNNAENVFFEGGIFSIRQNNFGAVKQLPPNWEILKLDDKPITLQIKGAVRITGDIRFEEEGILILDKEVKFLGKVINGVTN